MKDVRGSVGCLGLLLGLLACGGGGGGGADQPVPAPSNLVVVPGDSFKTYKATWTLPIGPIEAYELETKVGSQPYGLPARFPSMLSSWDYYFSDSVPELTDCLLRLRAINGTRYSSYSNECSYWIGLAPAESYRLYQGMVPGGLAVSWGRRSLAADTLLVERGLAPDAATRPQTWTAIPGLAPDVTEFVDTGTTEGTYNCYRVTYSKGQEAVTTDIGRLLVPLLPAVSLQVVPRIGGASLTWRNPSRLGQSLQVLRATNLDARVPESGLVATLPADATTFEDGGVMPGFYTYFIRTLKASGEVVDSLGAAAQVPPAAGQPAFSTSLQTLPVGTHRALASNGQWTFGDHFAVSQIKVITGGPAAWDLKVIPGYLDTSTPWLRLDAQDRPHIAYVKEATDAPMKQTLVHAWLEGGMWHSEDVVTRDFGGSLVERRLTFTLDASGAAHFLWAASSSSTQFNLEYGRKTAGGQWLVETLDPQLHGIDSLSAFLRLCLVVDLSGRPHVAFGTGYYGLIHHVTRSDAGAWTWARAATDLYLLNGESLAVGLTAGGNLRLFAEHQEMLSVDPTNPLVLSMIELVGGIWTTPRLLHRRQNVRLDVPLALSRFADRAALSYLGRVVTLLGPAGTSSTQFSPALRAQDEAPIPIF